jgi:hypothetical protein
VDGLDVQCPLSNRDCNETGAAEAMLHSGLEGIGTAHLGVDNDEPYRPVHQHGQTNEKQNPRE